MTERVTDAAGSPAPTWTVVLPVEPFTRDRPGWEPAGHRRTELAHAVYLDTLRAVRATVGVGLVVVVTADPLAAQQARTLGAVTAHGDPAHDPHVAAQHTAVATATLAPGATVAVITADLPALRPAQLARALAVARRHARAFVPDHTGNGVTLLASRGPTAGLLPAVGPGTRHRHARGGARELLMPGIAGLRHAVATPEDLVTARLRGVGPYTAAILATWDARVPVSAR